MSPKTPTPTGKMVKKALKKLGYELNRESGSHKIYTKPGQGAPVILATHKDSSEIPPGTFKAILRSMGISSVEFYSILENKANIDIPVIAESPEAKIIAFKPLKKKRQ